MSTHKLNFMHSLFALTERDFKLKYVGSLVGMYWHLIHPVVMIALYTLVFSNVMKSKLGIYSSPYAYSLYLCSGLLAWNFFTEMANRGCTTLSDNKDFIKKLSFKPYILFFASTFACFFNFLIGFALYSGILFFLDAPSLFSYLGYLGLVLMLSILGTSVAIILGCMNVFLKDVLYATQIAFQLLFWATPIVYMQSSLPDFAKKWIYLNPLYPFIELMHQALFYHTAPDRELLVWAFFWTALALSLSSFVYTRSISLLRDHL